MNRATSPVRLPWVSLGLSAVLGNVFALELRYPATPPLSPDTPSDATLLAFGALSVGRVLDAGEWYRLCTAELLHATPGHVVMNAIAILIAGWLLEPVVGRAWFLAACCAGGIGASAMDLAIASREEGAVGASGAIMGLLTVGLFASFRLVHSDARKALRRRVLLMLVPGLVAGLVPIDLLVDNKGHFGGVIAGIVVGLLLCWKWPVRSWTPPCSRLPVALAASGGLVFLGAAANAAWVWQHSIYRHLAPPGPNVSSQAAADLLVKTYPNDPTGWVQRGWFLYQADDWVAAERDLRAGLGLARQLFPIYPTQYETSVRGMLALALSAQGRRQDAIEAARAACQTDANAPLLLELDRLSLCDDR